MTTHVMPAAPTEPIRLFLAGDVMTGRGIDQILPHPADPRLYERYMDSAHGYVALAEAVNGPIPTPVEFAYVWGESLSALDAARVDARIVNLETCLTTSDEYQPKGINYRMHPKNVQCLTAADIDCCVLANNHALDWGHEGLLETLTTLEAAGIAIAGAGRDAESAARPAVIDVAGKGRVLVFAFAATSGGVPRAWRAGRDRPGVNLLSGLSASVVRRIAHRVDRVRRPGDVVVASIHWGGNWGYDIPHEQRRFACTLIDAAGVDVVHGHSSHHPKGIEVYRDRLVLYGAGDFLNDYEGIGGYEAFRGDLVLMYLPTIDPAQGALIGLDMMPFRLRRFRLEHAALDDARWLGGVLRREGAPLGTDVALTGEGLLRLSWR